MKKTKLLKNGAHVALTFQRSRDTDDIFQSYIPESWTPEAIIQLPYCKGDPATSGENIDPTFALAEKDLKALIFSEEKTLQHSDP